MPDTPSIPTEANNPSPPATAKNESKTIRDVIIGAVISLISTVGVTSLQARYQFENQRKEFIFENRIAAIKEFAGAIRNDGELLDRFNRFETEIYVVVVGGAKPEEAKKLAPTYFELSLEEERWMASLRTQAIVMNALLGPSFSPAPLMEMGQPEYPTDLETSNLSKRGLLESVTTLQTHVRKHHETVVTVMNSYEKYLEDLAQKIRDNPPK